MKKFSSFEYQNKTLDYILEEVKEDKVKEAFEFMQNAYEALPSYKSQIGEEYYKQRMNNKWKIIYEAVKTRYESKRTPKDASDWIKGEAIWIEKWNINARNAEEQE